MAFLYDKSAPLAFILSAIFVIVVNGVKSVGLSVMAFKLKSVIDTGEYSVITNAVASLAGGVAPTVIGIIIEKRGWSASYLTVFAICLAVLVTVFAIDAVIRVSMKKHERTSNGKIA